MSNIEAILHFVLDTAVDLLRADFGNIQLLVDRSLRIVAKRGFGEGFLATFREVRIGDGTACARALERRQPIVVPDVEIDKEFAQFRSGAKEAGFRAVVTVPMMTDQKVIGLVSTHFRKPHLPDAMALKILAAFCGAAAQRIETLLDPHRLQTRAREMQAALYSRPSETVGVAGKGANLRSLIDRSLTDNRQE